MSEILPHPTVDEIFEQPQQPADLDVDQVFAAAEGLSNPLSVPLVDALRKVRILQDRLDWSAQVVKAAVALLHGQEHELRTLRKRNIQLIDELRGKVGSSGPKKAAA
jgi:hypothetical protein